MSRYDRNRFFIAKEPDVTNVFLKDIELRHVLAFFNKIRDAQTESREPIRVSDYIAPDLIKDLEFRALRANKSGAVMLPGAGSGGIRSQGRQMVHNSDLWVLLAYMLKPENQEEMHKQLLVSSFPATTVDFSVMTNYAKNFSTFVRAVYVYIDRYEDKVDLLTHFSDEFYPTNVFKHQQCFGQVDYFLAAFPNKDFVIRIRKHISVKVSKSIKTFDEFLVHFLEVMEIVEKHFKVDRKLIDTLVYGSSADKPDTSTKKYDPTKSKFDFPKTTRFQKINTLEDNAESSTTDELIRDLFSEDPDIFDNESDQDLPEPIVEDEELHDVDVSEEVEEVLEDEIGISPALNAIDTPKPPTLVCYAKVNHGVCTNKECKYSHDENLIAKFKAQRHQSKKVSSPGSGTKPSAPIANRKYGTDNKRRA